VKSETGSRAKKSLGQHFLVSERIIQKILGNFHLEPTDHVLEIGPGRGALTYPLVKKVEKLLLIEKDTELAERLRQQYHNFSNLEILDADFLNISFDQINSHLSPPYKIVSNLPYNVATPILTKLLLNVPPTTLMVLMFQKEVGDRLLATPHHKDYGSFTIFVQLFAEVRLLLTIGRSAFHPPPKIESSVLRFKIRDKPLLPFTDLEKFERLLKAGFGQRRKMLRQNLRPYFSGNSAEDIEDRLRAVEALPTARAEELSLSQWLSLFRQGES
jgi:16S rRNA (adenine1518-N6/adenine1519-N6)-dimethyltransferase